MKLSEKNEIVENLLRGGFSRTNAETLALVIASLPDQAKAEYMVAAQLMAANREVGK